MTAPETPAEPVCTCGPPGSGHWATCPIGGADKWFPSVPETPDELRARFARLPAEMERLLEKRAEREYSTSYETSGFYVFSRSHLDDFIEYAIALIDWGTIDALLARLTAAEAVCEAIMEDPNNVGIGVVEALANYWALAERPQ